MTVITKVLSLAAIEKTPDYLFVDNGFTQRECSACLDDFVPTTEDISTRRPSTFYKQCGRCRDRFNVYRKNKELKDLAKHVDSL